MTAKVVLLRVFGPYLGRPHADTLKGSSIPKLKELRAKTAANVLRAAFLFDEERQAILLVGGDKKGIKERASYKRLIRKRVRTSELCSGVRSFADAEALVRQYRL
jgi:hypothetical protein